MTVVPGAFSGLPPQVSQTYDETKAKGGDGLQVSFIPCKKTEMNINQ